MTYWTRTVALSMGRKIGSTEYLSSVCAPVEEGLRFVLYALRGTHGGPTCRETE